MSTFGDRLRAVRKYYNLTQAEFAEAIGMDQGYFSSIERDKKKPSDRLCQTIYEKYKINPEWLTSADGNMFVGEPADVVSLIKPRIKTDLDVIRNVVMTVEECTISSKKDFSPKIKADIVVFYCDYFNNLDEVISSKGIGKEIRETFKVVLKTVGG